MAMWYGWFRFRARAVRPSSLPPPATVTIDWARATESGPPRRKSTVRRWTGVAWRETSIRTSRGPSAYICRSSAGRHSARTRQAERQADLSAVPEAAVKRCAPQSLTPIEEARKGRGGSPTPGPTKKGQARPGASRRRRAFPSTPSNIAGVSRPVFVFCRLTWYEPRKVTKPRPGTSSAVSAPCPNAGAGRGIEAPASPRTRSADAHARPPSARKTRTFGRSASSRTKNGRQRSNSSGVGRLSGGAQRTGART